MDKLGFELGISMLSGYMVTENNISSEECLLFIDKRFLCND